MKIKFSDKSKIAIIRIRGKRNIEPKIKKTLELLRLRKPNHCVVMENSCYVRGMLNLVKDYVTFGQIDNNALERLLYKKGKKGAKRLSEILNNDEIVDITKKIMDGAKVSEFATPVFALKPPRKGYKDIKQPYPKGDLGARPDISPLIKRMT
ncbi:MAG: uL30 family ribosomal protein [Candidatus Micrarchaeota archaeon]